MLKPSAFGMVVAIGTALGGCARPCKCGPEAARPQGADAPSSDEASAPEFPLTQVATVRVTQANDVSYKVDKCELRNRNQVHCSGMAVSPKVDRKGVRFMAKAIDNLGREYRAKAFVAGKGQGAWDRYPFLADTPTTLEFVIENFSTDATAINALEFGAQEGRGRFTGLPIETPPPAAVDDPAYQAPPGAPELTPQ